MPKFKNGLIVGKFAPLHMGHKYVIRTALESCEQVFILSYSKPEFENFPPERRVHWLKLVAPNAEVLVLDDAICRKLNLPLLPNNDDSDHEQREFVARVCQDVFDVCPEAVFTSEKYGDGFAAHLQTYFGKPVRHICVDLNRDTYPISGTKIRADIHANQSFLPVDIYTEFVKSICFLGAESTGKSTLTKKLATLYDTNYVSEYGRELWEEKEEELEYDDFQSIAQTHISNELEAKKTAHRYVFVDTAPLTTLFYCMDTYGHAESELRELADHKYDCVFLCAPDFPLVQDGTRQNEEFRRKQHLWYVNELKQRKISHTILKGNLQNKIQNIQNTLSRNFSD